MKSAELLRLIEVYLKATGTSPSAFGQEALGDRTFVFELRKNRRVFEETAEKILKYLKKTG